MKDLKLKTIIKNDKYEIIRKIGKGGSCEVWLARDIKLLTYWVVKKTKIISRENFEVFRKLKIANHITVPQIIDYWEEDGYIYFVEEYIKGTALNMIKYEKLEISTIIKWAKTISEILEFIHDELSIVHRDIKPANIIINEYGVPFLIDFGESIIMSKNRDVGKIDSYGTLKYCSPEQVLFIDKVNYQSDIYSFGTVFKEMIEKSGGVVGNEFRFIVQKSMEVIPSKRWKSFREVKFKLSEL